MNKIIISLIIGIMLLTTISALGFSNNAYDLGEINRGQCIDLYQNCPNCTYVNLTTIILPNGTIQNYNLGMTKSGADYTIQDCVTGDSGEYKYAVCGNPTGDVSCETLSFGVREEGKGSMSDIAIALLTIAMGSFIYFFIYKFNKFMGNMSFMILGLGITFLFLRSGEQLMIFMGIMIALFSAIKMIWDLIENS